MFLGGALIACLGVLAVGFHNADPVRPAPELRPPRATTATPPRPVAPPGSAPSPRSAPGIRLDATPRSDGTFDVVETITLRIPTDRLIFAAPSAPLAGAAFAASRPRANSVVLRAGGLLVPMRPAEVGTRRVVLLDSPVDRIELRYRLTGAIIRSVPSKADRALGLLAPLAAGLDGSLPTNLTVARARNLFCPLLSSTQQRCAAEDPHGMTSLPGLAADDATVLVQLDLPPPVRRS